MSSNTNVINALINLYNLKNLEINETSKTGNRINDVGANLETYIKKLFINKKDRDYPNNAGDYFSYQGSKNNPPDFILRKGDAFEIKKLEAVSSDISLNSSFPKETLKFDDPKLTNKCKNSELKQWKEKDFFYIIGYQKNKLLKHVFFIQGPCFACSYNYYNQIFKNLKKHIHKGNFTFSETKEIARLNNIDPLDYTDLRIRPMFILRNPFKIFEFCKINKTSDLNVFCIMTSNKYFSFQKDVLKLLEKEYDIEIQDKNIASPMNKNNIIKCKYIHFHLGSKELAFDFNP